MAKANVMIDNQKTRVTEWTFEVGDETGQHIHEYDYVVVNDDIDQTEEKLKIIITAERLRLSQQPGIVEFVRGLNSEFGDR